MTACLDPDAVQAFLDGTVDDAARPAIEDHVDQCEACRRLVAALAIDLHRGVETVPGSPGAGSSRGRDTRSIGRYRTVKTLGSGGMGIVFEAHDPELRRDIAVKLLRSEQLGEDSRRRMVREAQAMAQVQHPNVISVYDVGTWNGEVFIAMELASGGTLRDWCKRDRTPAEIVAAFVSAGRGLAAAHAAGLVHRDFKPDNVLVAADGRMLVTDFGLARTHDMPLELPTPQPRRQLGTLTATGTIMGTPGYMAPEQSAGLPADARSDQFAFCVALWEAVYTQRPFAGHDENTLAASAMAGDIVEPDPAVMVPVHVATALRRGLSSDPDLRFASMTELLDALAMPPSTHRTRSLVVTAAALVAAALLGTYVAWPSGSTGSTGTTGTTATTATTGTTATTSGDAPGAEAVVRSLQLQIDTTSAQIAAITGDHAASTKAQQAVESARAWGSKPELVDALVAQATVAGFLQDYPAGKAAAFEALTLAERIHYDTGKARAADRYAHLLTLDNRPDEANRWKQLATATNAEPAATPTWHTRGLEVIARATRLEHAGHSDEARTLFRRELDSVHARRTPDLEPTEAILVQVMEAELQEAVAKLDEELGDHAAAMRNAKAAIELGGNVFGHTSPQLAPMYGTLATAELHLDQRDSAEANLQHALDIAGSDVLRATLHTRAALGYANVKRTGEALAHARAGIALAIKALGPSHPTTLGYHYIEADALARAGKRDDAIAVAEQTLPALAAANAEPLLIAAMKALLARLLPTSQHTRALELATAARPILAARPGRFEPRDALEAWFARRGAKR